MQTYLPFIMYYGNALLLFTGKLHCLQTFDRLLYVESSDPTYVQNCRPVPLEILGFTLKNENDKIFN